MAKVLFSEGRLLLGHAVDRAESPYQVSAVDPDNVAIGENIGKSVERNSVVRIIEHRNQDGAISDVEIRITSRQAAAFEINRRRHRKINRGQRFAIFDGRIA